MVRAASSDCLIGIVIGLRATATRRSASFEGSRKKSLLDLIYRLDFCSNFHKSCEGLTFRTKRSAWAAEMVINYGWEKQNFYRHTSGKNRIEGEEKRVEGKWGACEWYWWWLGIHARWWGARVGVVNMCQWSMASLKLSGCRTTVAGVNKTRHAGSLIVDDLFLQLKSCAVKSGEVLFEEIRWRG